MKIPYWRREFCQGLDFENKHVLKGQVPVCEVILVEFDNAEISTRHRLA